MSVTTPTVNLTAGVNAQLPLPQSINVAKVVVANLSSFLVQMFIGSDIYWHPPWTSEQYDLTNAGAQPLIAVPFTPSGTFPQGSSEELTATWYLGGENIEGTYPLSLVANALAASISGGTITLSGQIPVVNGTPSPLLVGVTAAPLATGPASGQTSVVATGTAVQLANLAATKTGVLVAARKANTAPVYIGPSTVTAANGLELSAGGPPVLISVDNASRLYVNGAAGDGVTYLAL